MRTVAAGGKGSVALAVVSRPAWCCSAAAVGLASTAVPWDSANVAGLVGKVHAPSTMPQHAVIAGLIRATGQVVETTYIKTKVVGL